MERIEKVTIINNKIQHVYIIGSKGIPAKYGGFETFVEKLTEYQKSDRIKYHVACMNLGDNLYGNGKKHFEHNGADCFNIDIPAKIGPARAILYDLKAIKYSINLAKINKDNQPIFYILACRIGPFMKNIQSEIHRIGGKVFVNPDGHEWLRAKWSKPVRKYWKESEKLMVKHSDLLICDSKNIEKYICKNYKQYSPKTIYIAYGTDLTPSNFNNHSFEVKDFFKKNNLEVNEYYLVVGRFVPENNYEAMIKGFMKSNTNKDFVIITNPDGNKYYKELQLKTNFDTDSRIKFVGTVYNQDLLKYIRENAFAYIHGHEVGGTNPSLLEALATTKINLLFDVGFNREVARDSAFYWEKTTLKPLINHVENLTNNIENLVDNPKEIMRKNYSWESIIDSYENTFNGEKK